MLTIESASSPQYASADGTCITLQVKFAEFDLPMPFGATSHDPMPYGVELFERAKAGEFGEVAPFVAPPEIAQTATTGAQSL